jgi:hypothetical protein
MIYTLIFKPKFRKILKALVLVILFAFSVTLYSCSSSDPYPNDWGNVMDVQKHGDSIISGNYDIHGETTGKNNAIYTITRLIELPGLSEIQSDYDNIVIKLYKEDSLLILLRANSDTIFKTVFPGNGIDISVTEDGLEMDPVKRKSGGDLGFVLPLFSNSKLILMKGADSSLIVKSNGWGVGLFFMIPVYGSVTTWFKFPQYKTK